MARINGREYEYADIKVALMGAQIEGLRGITYKTSQSKELVYGAGNKPSSIQRGNFKHEGTLTMFKSDYDLLDAAAVSAGYESLLHVPGSKLTCTIVYCQTSDLSKISTESLINLEFTEIEDGMKQGDTFKEVSLPFIFLRKKKVS